MAFLATGFQDADRDDSGSLITCLEAISTHPFFIGVKEESYRLLQIIPGCRILEVGCGTGSDAQRMSILAGSEGLVAAVDPGVNMLKEAKSRVLSHKPPDSGGAAPEFFRMDGRSLGFPDSSFDMVREDRSLQHIRNPEAMIREMARVLRPGGRFVLFEPDWELFIIDAADRVLTRKILNFWADQFMNGWIGRELYRLCTENGIRGITVLPRTMIMHDLLTCDQIFGIRDTVLFAEKTGIIDRISGIQWLTALEDADRSGRFFSSFTGYLVYGEKS